MILGSRFSRLLFVVHTTQKYMLPQPKLIFFALEISDLFMLCLMCLKPRRTLQIRLLHDVHHAVNDLSKCRNVETFSYSFFTIPYVKEAFLRIIATHMLR